MRSTTHWILLLLAALLLVPSVALADLEDDIDELNDRVDQLEVKAAKDRLNFYGDFRVRYDYQKWHVNPYNQLMGFDMTSGQPVPVFMPVGEQELKNSEAWSARLRLKLDYKLSKTLKFTGRLNMHRQFGGPSYQMFNGFPNTVHTAFNSVAVASDDIMRVERAAMTWDPEWVPLFLTLGRQAATGGPPRHFSEDKVRQGTPSALMIDAQIDGLMLGLHLDRVGLPEASVIRLCYGTGFESGFGSGGKTSSTYVNMYFPNANFDPNNPANGPLQYEMPMQVGELKDSKVAGFCAESPVPPLGGENLLSAGYMRLIDMVDIPYGMTRGFPNVLSTQDQVVTATTNLGDMDLWGLCWQHSLDLGESAYELDYFASIAGNTSHPDEGSASLYGFGPLLGSDTESKSGFAYYLGVRGDVPGLDGKLGLEYNHGNANWFAYLPAADDINSKLSTRGSVFEAYYIQPLQRNLDLRLGYQLYKYDYAFSGWHIAPAPIEDYYDLDNANTASPYPFPDQIDNFYVVMDMSF